jgi:hypothetical protein
MPYTKSQLLTKYDIPFKAFEVLQGLDLFRSQFVAKNGLSVVTLTKEDAYALECARLTVPGFRGAPLLPFHRFLILRFLCLPVKDVYEELMNTGLLASRERFDLAYLKKIHKKMVARAPKEIKKMLTTNAVPTTKLGKQRLEIFLRAMNILYFYHYPKQVENLDYFLQAKLVVELILTTSGSNGEIAEYFSKNMKATIEPDSVVGYRLLYYSTHEMEKSQWKSYLATIAPDERKAKADARGKDLLDYSIMKGLKGIASITDILERAKMRYIRELSNSQGFQTPSALQAQRSCLDSILKIDQYQRDLGGDDTDIWKVFERFAVRASDDAEPRSISDIRPETKAIEAAQ